jgi:hypothetical protein
MEKLSKGAGEIVDILMEEEFDLSMWEGNVGDGKVYPKSKVREFIRLRDKRIKLLRDILMNSKLPISKRLIQNVFEDLKEDNKELAGRNLQNEV